MNPGDCRVSIGIVDERAKLAEVCCPLCRHLVPVDVPAEWSANLLDGLSWEPWVVRVVAMSCPTVWLWTPRSWWRRWLLRLAGYALQEHEKVTIR